MSIFDVVITVERKPRQSLDFDKPLYYAQAHILVDELEFCDNIKNCENAANSLIEALQNTNAKLAAAYGETDGRFTFRIIKK